MAGPEPDDGEQEPGGEDSAGQGDSRGPGDGRRDAARHGDRRLRAVHGRRPELRQRHLRREPAVGDPAAHITWFQAQEACANAGKQLPTSAEWQVAANGTPDPGPDNRTTDCNSASDIVTRTGSRSSCVSSRGAFDMVGNLDEWVADWVPLSTECSDWGGFSDDLMCLSGASSAGGGPGALLRGGDFRAGSSAGPLAVVGSGGPSNSRVFIGFRCAR